MYSIVEDDDGTYRVVEVDDMGQVESTVAFGFETEDDAQAWMDENL